MSSPLSDIRVVAIEQYAAGPYGSLHLAELGADVIKIEQMPDGDVGRDVPPYRSEHDSLFFQSLNRSKKSVMLELGRPEGRQVLCDLVRVSDAVYSNLRGDVPERLAIRYQDLAEVNPLIVCCSLSGYGMTGPRARNPGFDYMMQGLTGWMSITGEPDGPPTKSGLSAVDFATGLVAVTSLLSGVHAARRDGIGGDCDVSLYDTALSMLNYLATWTMSTDHEAARITRSGHPTLVPFANFPTSDGWIVAGGSKEKFWRRLALALDRSALLDDPRFATFSDRLEHKAELIAELDGAFSPHTTADWLRILEEARVPCAPVNTIREALAEPQALARDDVFFQQHDALGRVGQVASPVRYGTDPHRRGPAPKLGEHTLEVLEDVLGYDRTRIRTLAAEGVVAGPGLS